MDTKYKQHSNVIRSYRVDDDDTAEDGIRFVLEDKPKPKRSFTIKKVDNKYRAIRDNQSEQTEELILSVPIEDDDDQDIVHNIKDKQTVKSKSSVAPAKSINTPFGVMDSQGKAIKIPLSSISESDNKQGIIKDSQDKPSEKLKSSAVTEKAGNKSKSTKVKQGEQILRPSHIFWKVSLSDFIRVMKGLNGKEIEVLCYILSTTKRSDNTFTATYEKIIDKTSVSRQTVAHTLSALKAKEFIVKKGNGVWMINPKYLAWGREKKVDEMMRNYRDAKKALPDSEKERAKVRTIKVTDNEYKSVMSMLRAERDGQAFLESIQANKKNKDK